jgi:enamine deaminase RidA (YjgF/YER057c/UK114 family)
VRTGNVIYVSGRVAKKEGKPWVGKLGENITIEEGKQAARDIAVELIATLQAAVGDLNKITRIVKLVVLVNSTPHFTEPHVVANGASELLREVFGERGTHARSSFGVAQLPFGCCVEIEMVVETFGSESVCEVVERPEAHTTEYISREWKVLPAQVAKTLTLRVGEDAIIVVTCGDSPTTAKSRRS